MRPRRGSPDQQCEQQPERGIRWRLAELSAQKLIKHLAVPFLCNPPSPPETPDQQPDQSLISEFLRGNLDEPKDLFISIWWLSQKAGMGSLGHVALDGTKVKANADKQMTMTHERMMRAEILHNQADRRYGSSNRRSDLPDELRRRQESLERIREACKKGSGDRPAKESNPC